MDLINLTMYHVPMEKLSDVISDVEFIAGQPVRSLFPNIPEGDVRLSHRYILVECLENSAVKYHIKDKGSVRGEVFERIIGETTCNQREIRELREKAAAVKTAENSGESLNAHY